MCTFHLFSELTVLTGDEYMPFGLSECIPSWEDTEDGQTYWKSKAWVFCHIAFLWHKTPCMCARKGHDGKLIAATLEDSVIWLVHDFMFSLHEMPTTTKCICSFAFAQTLHKASSVPDLLPSFLGTIVHLLIDYIWRRNVPSIWALVSTTSINMYYW